MRTRIFSALFLLLLCAAAVWYWRWTTDTPRRAAIETLKHLDTALRSGSREELASLVILPAALQQRTVAERAEFIGKALRDEISAEGISDLRKHGTFGSLSEVFPVEGSNWAAQAGVAVEDCLAFKSEHQGRRSEVVLTRPPALDPQLSTSATYRLIRCNNVRELAVVQASGTQ